MKDLGEAYVNLGIKIIRDGNHIGLSQSHYKKIADSVEYMLCSLNLLTF